MRRDCIVCAQGIPQPIILFVAIFVHHWSVVVSLSSYRSCVRQGRYGKIDVQLQH